MSTEFDWRAYVERYPELVAAGIDDEAKASMDWRNYGQAEGRRGAPPSYPTRHTFACPTIHSIYVRWTGDIVCWDDAGNETLLQRYDPAVDYGRDVYLGAPFNRVRFALSAGTMPFPDVCTRCLVLRTNTEHSSFHLDRRVVEVFQVEPSFKCTLDCPGCVRLDQRKLAPPSNLPLDRFEKIVRDLRNANVDVRAFDFQGHGEPILHPNLPEMITTARAIYPTAYLVMTTNANGKLKDALLRSGIDEIVCSIDGMDQPSYAPYRIHGNFALAFRFMADVARRRNGARPKVVWKYILFEHNSDERQLAEAQRLAASAGVDELVFVFTRNGPRSTTVTSPLHIPHLGCVPMSMRFHEPDSDDLEQRRREARALENAGQTEQAVNLLRSIERNQARFGLSTAYGQTTSPTPIGNGTANAKVAANLTGLTVNTTYHYRRAATNDGGTASGSDVSFTTATNTFGDVPSTHLFFTWIEALFAAGITGGSSSNPMKYCPDTLAWISTERNSPKI